MKPLTQEDYKANIGLIHMFARKCYGRLQKAGVAMDYDDVFQELSIVFVRAWEGYDPTVGKFSTYFARGCYYEFNRKVDSLIAERLEHGVVSVEEMNTWTDSEELSIEETIPSEEQTPEEVMEIALRLKRIEANCSPLTQTVIKWLLQPPPELIAEIDAKRAHSEFARKVNGYGRVIRQDISVQGILDFLKKINPKAITNADLKRTREELGAVTKGLV